MLSKFFFISILISSLIFSANSYNGHLLCLDHQKSLLLQLKNELIFYSSISTKLVQWNKTHDCCNWNGVDCDSAGHIISLQLDKESISGGIGNSSSLFRLSYLEKLNLAYNDFDRSTTIPKGIHSLNYLTHLDLSYAGFGGQVPIEITYLRRLVSLDISNDAYLIRHGVANDSLKLEYPNLEMLVQNLTGLRELHLDGVNITSSYERTKWSKIVSSYLPHLTTFSCVHCSLSGPFARSFSQLHSLSTLQLDWNDLSAVVPAFFANFSRLTTLGLVDCDLKGSFPNMIFHIPTLQNLDLSQNELLSGSLPPFTLNGSLQSVRLRETNFSGLIPKSITYLKNLSELDMSSCKFTGSIFPSTFANVTQLTYVDLSDNSFSGNIPHSLFALPSLLNLYLGNNHFTGEVEAFSTVLNVSNILRLDLAGNQLEEFSDSLVQFQSLQYLFLSHNLFTGTVLEQIRSLPNLLNLDLSFNDLRVDESNRKHSTWGFPQLTQLSLSSCKVNDFPDFIKHSPSIMWLNLSDNGIGGEIPNWIWGLTQLASLDLSHNLLTGLQTNVTSQLEYLFLSNNSLTGSIPTSLCTATNLGVVDLSVNKLSGSIPSCLHAMSFSAIDLGRNNLSGHIPDITSPYCKLEYFDLNTNTLEGEIPRSLKNCEKLTYMNVGNNIINDTFPCMLPSSLRVLVLHSNTFHGEVTSCDNSSWPDLQILDIFSNHFSGSLEKINFSSWKGMAQGSPYKLWNGYFDSDYYDLSGYGVTLIMKGLQVELYKIWSDFSSIDLSCNNFKGEIPNVIGDLRLLRLLNVSHNALNGSIPKSFGKLRNLESLDLSRNQLIGAIPMELGGLTFLSVLNLSYNMLVGEIPNGRQLQTFTADSFKGNPWLCGFPLNINCSQSVDESDLSHENEEGKKEVIEWEYVSAALGFVVGLGSIVWLLLFCRSFRKQYFDKIDDVVEEMFDARDMRRRRRAARRRAVRNQAVMRRRQ